MSYLLLSLGFLLVAGLVAFGLWYRRRHRWKVPGPVPKAAQAPSRETKPSLAETKAIDQFLYDRCCEYMMVRKPFLVPFFTLGDLASALMTNRVYLSKTINRFSGKNFRQYVNYYRVMYSIELFRDNQSLRVSELAELAGFHSSTAFFQSFKLVMGEPPSLWCSRMRKHRRHSLKK